MWKVYIDNQYSGIIETNYAWASTYWQNRARLTNSKIKLKKVD